MMIKKRRHFLTLIEVMIAMGLSMILISVVVYFYQQLSLINIAMDKAQNEHFQKRFLEYRLNAIIPMAVGPENKDFHFFISPNNQGLFYEKSQSLVFTFNNGVKLDKLMSDLVIGRLFLDEKNQLTFAAWPIPKRWVENEPPPLSKEVLMENIISLSFEFYTPPDKGKIKFVNKQENKTTTQINKPNFPDSIRNQFQPDWRKEYRQLPAVVKVLITRKNGDKIEKMTFAYPLPKTQQPIIYTQ